MRGVEFSTGLKYYIVSTPKRLDKRDRQQRRQHNGKDASMTVITTFSKITEWEAVAQFPHANNPYKYHEYDYRGFGDSPQEATNSLMEQLEANTFVYDYTYFIPERLTLYSPATCYDADYKTWYVEIEFQQADSGDTDVMVALGDTPRQAIKSALATLPARGVYVPPGQRREAEDLFTV